MESRATSAGEKGLGALAALSLIAPQLCACDYLGDYYGGGEVTVVFEAATSGGIEGRVTISNGSWIATSSSATDRRRAWAWEPRGASGSEGALGGGYGASSRAAGAPFGLLVYDAPMSNEALAARVGVGVVVLAGFGTSSSTAHAGQDRYSWCLDPDGGGPTAPCCDDADNITPFTTFEETIAAVEAAEGPSAEERPEQQTVCVATETPSAIDLLIDFTASDLGPLLLIDFGDGLAPNWCPGQAGIVVVGPATSASNPSLSVNGLNFDAASCGQPVDPMMTVLDANLEVVGARLLGPGPDVIRFSTTPGGSVSNIDIKASRFEGFNGQAAVGTGELRLDRTEISAFDSLNPIIDVENTDGALWLDRVLLFGNAAQDGVPLVRTRTPLRILNSSLVANEVEQGGSLLFAQVDNGGGQPHTIQQTVFSDNRIHPADGATAAQVPERIPAQIDLCLPTGTDGSYPRDRQRPTKPAAGGPGALVHLAGTASSTSYVLITKSYFVQNTIGVGGALVRLEESAPGRVVTFLHNTCDEPVGSVVHAATQTSRSRLISARNLLLGSPFLQLGAGWDFVESTMDDVEGNPSAWASSFSGAAGISGPYPTAFLDGPGDLLLADASQQPSDCERALAHCADMTVDDCTPATLGEGRAFCGLDLAADYLPSSSGLALAADWWPWRNAGFPQTPVGSPENFPGASGWTCSKSYVGALTDGDFGGFGDQDGFTGLVDCNNSDPDVVPEVPDLDGHTTAECEENECYTCPSGDDDDIGNDDDDIRDDDAADDDSSSDDLTVPTGCTGRGCGVAIPIAFLPLTALSLRRRRRWG